MIRKIIADNKGVLFLEILVVVAIVAVIVTLSAQLIGVSLVANEKSGERGIALSLASEEFDYVKALSAANWQYIYDLNTKGTSTTYYIAEHSETPGQLTTTTDTETVTIDGQAYTRYFYVHNVCRDTSSRNIVATHAGSCNSGEDDPSTQRVTVVVEYGGGDSVSWPEFVTRFRNQTCDQKSWGGGSGGGTSNCPADSYDELSSGTDIEATATILLLPS